MKKILSVLITSTTLTTAAFSNAGPAPMPTPCPACPTAPIPCWGGFKLGLQLGYGQYGNKLSYRVEEGAGPTIYRGSLKTTTKGAIGGVHAGYDLQFAKMWLVGINTSFDFNGLSGKSRFRVEPDEIFSTQAKSQYTIAVVPRVGMVMNDSLFYVGAGWAGSTWKTNTRILDNTLRRNKSEFLNALRVSVGAAQKMNKFLLGVEVNFDSYESLSSRAANVDDSFRTTYKPRMLSGMVKLSYMLCNTAY